MKVTIGTWTGEVAIQGETLAYRGPHTLFTIGRQYRFNDTVYEVLSITTSMYIPGVLLVKLKEIS